MDASAETARGVEEASSGMHTVVQRAHHTPSDPLASAEPVVEPTAPSRPLAIAASIVPGLVLHGSGSWVLGERDVASRILLMEGLGAGAVLLSGTGLALTGAARSMVAPLALLGIAGVNVFFMSFATDLYNTVSPDEGWGRARPWRPLLRAQLGYVYIVDPIFDYSHLLTHGLTLRSGPWVLGYQGWHAPEQQHARGRASVGYGLWGASSGRAAPDGSFAEVELALGGQQFDEADFDVVSGELQVLTRLDSERILPDVRGAFFELSAGVGLRRTTFRVADIVQQDSLLLARSAFGFYIGDGQGADVPHGEWQMYYDHRHDDFAAGFKVNGLGSGVIGHIGTSFAYDFASGFGVEAYTEIGSAWVSGLGLSLSEGGP